MDSYEDLLKQLEDQEQLLNHFRSELEDSDEQDLSDVLYLLTTEPIQTGSGNSEIVLISLI